MLVTLVSEGTASVHANIKASSLSRHAITSSRPLLKGFGSLQRSAMQADHLTLLPGALCNKSGS